VFAIKLSSAINRVFVYPCLLSVLFFSKFTEPGIFWFEFLERDAAKYGGLAARAF
jgi:hypothetical protein